MKQKKIKIYTVTIKLLDLLISLLIVNIVNDICTAHIPLINLSCLCFLATIKWVIKKDNLHLFITESKQIKNKILSCYFFSNQNDKLSTHLSKIFETDIELWLSYETNHKIAIIFCFVMIGLYSVMLALNNLVLSFIVLGIGFFQGIIPKLYEEKFSNNYEKTCVIEEEIENFYYEIIDHFEKCYFLPVSYLIGILNNKNKEYAKIGVKSEATAQKYNGLMNALNIISQIGICFICVLLANAGNLPPTKILGITYLSIQTINIFSEVFQFYQLKPSAQVAQKRIKEIIDTGTDITKIAPLENKKLFLIKGKNGAGKSTLLKKQLTEDTEELFYLPQNELMLNMCPNELFSSFSLTRQSYIKEMFNWNENLGTHLLPTLSSGERKKAELMCAFMSNKNLYLDEPENALDADNRLLLLRAIENYSFKIVIATNSDLYNKLQREEFFVNYA